MQTTRLAAHMVARDSKRKPMLWRQEKGTKTNVEAESMSGGSGPKSDRKWYTVVDNRGCTKAIIRDKHKAEYFFAIFGGKDKGWRVLEGKMYAGCTHDSPDHETTKSGR